MTLGKTPGTDIKEKKPSMVNILWLASGNSLAQNLISDKPISDDIIKSSINYLRNSDVINECRELAKKYALSALEHLNEVSSSSSLTIDEHLIPLKALVHYTLSRVE
jgi:geranylgeranyl pyrophosphate synthase